MKKYGLSKSRFVAGWQCHKLLWWRVHDPNAPELQPDVAQQAVFDRGIAVGELARSHVTGGVLIDFPHSEVEQKLRATADAVAGKARAIYEASFRADGVFVAVDVLEKARGGWNLVEVKSTIEAKPEHDPDAAIQLHVAERAGLTIRRVQLMHLNKECRYPDLSNLFARTDLTDAARELLPRVKKEIRAQLRMLDGRIPKIAAGDQCSEPRECPFFGRCNLELPPHHVSTLYRIRKDKAAALVAKGIHTIFELPADYKLSEIAARQRAAVQANSLIVETGLRAALAKWQPPIAFLDFETIYPAIPVWKGCAPYGHVPVQFSCHVLHRNGSLTHTDWIADGSADPRKEFGTRVVKAVKGARSILAWNARFERDCLTHIGDCFPRLASDVNDVKRRLDDLLPAVRNYVYHPDFYGSFSIKNVLPALAPDMCYDDMDIGEGQAAANALETMLLHGEDMPAEEKARLRESLLRYCELDTLAMAKVYDRLRALAGPKRG